MRRFQRLSAIPTLVGLVLALDLIWALVAGSTGALAYALVDEPAHLVICAVVVFALALASGSLLAPSSRRLGELAAAAVLAAVSLALPTHAKAAKPKPRPKISIGAYIPEADRDPGLIERFGEETGRHPALVSFYRIWGPPLVDTAQLGAASEAGSVPMLTWEPWDEDEHGVSLWSIAAGEEDAYISEAAREAAAWGGPVFLRFAHEMNGNWYPWGWGVDGNTPAAYKAAWRHVVDVFRGSGASNVRWVWCPYVSNKRLKQFRRFYPGDEYVDWTCLDGFNWGSYRAWQSFKEIFGLSYESLAKLTRRPIMIGETGVNQAGGDKARWLTRSLRKVLPEYTHVRAVVWYDTVDDRADFRVDSSPESLAAFRGALSQPLFASDASGLLSTPAELTSPQKERRKHRRKRGQER